VDPERGVVLEAVNLRWDDVPLAAILSKRLKLDAYLDNDVNVAVYGENRLGAGRNARNLLGVWLGTGIGGGLILNGELYYGHFWTAGEIGHTILLPNMPRGMRSLEQACSRTAIVDRLVRLIRANQKSKVTSEVGDDFSKIKSRTLGRYYRESEREDKLVVEVVDAAADLLGQAIGSVVTLLSLPRVVLGGGLVEAVGGPFVDRVQRVVREVAFPDACKKVDVVASKLEDTAGVLGAALIAMERAGQVKK
jgi:glucokinase